jgi:hypothetical protein
MKEMKNVKMHAVALSLSLAVHATLFAQAQPQLAPPVVAIEKRGPAVGTRAPEIRARDQFGHDQTLKSLRGRGGLVLLFVRSADW